MSLNTVTAEELKRLRQEDADLELIDVRTPAEFGEVHVEFARNVPLDRLDATALFSQRGGQGSKPLYVLCRSGKRGQMACERLLAAGCANVVNVSGGTDACVQAGLPVIRGRKVMSLERQVRIAAGFLVLTGVLLGWLVYPALYGLSAFVGSGLIFAGITDSCLMGMLIARMPWNQAPSGAATCCPK